MTMKPPQFATDLFRDLRDRKLLPLVVLLAAALVAVPVLLAKPAKTPPPPAAAPATTSATAAQPAVFAAQPGIRNYRKRLDQLKSKNPFANHFKLPANPSSALEDVPASGGVAGGSAAEASSTPAPSSTASTQATTTASQPTGSGTGAVTSSGSSTSGTAGGIKLLYFTLTPTVKFGKAGGYQKEYDGLSTLQDLPSSDTPVVAYLGITSDAKRAAFYVSADVTAVGGDGKCTPTPALCQFVSLRPGEAARLTYQPAGATTPVVYRLLVKDIHVERVQGPQAKDPLQPKSR